MGLHISFFSTPKHKVFHYNPMYYDETKEKIGHKVAEAKREKAIREGKTPKKNVDYVPGTLIRGKITSNLDNNRKSSIKPGSKKLITLLGLIILFILVFSFGDYFIKFLGIIK
ncbi:MAG: hypothetical protein WC140_03790 [Bacteroidales bacterium]